MRLEGDQPSFNSVDHERETVFHFEFAEDGSEMVRDGGLADVQVVGDFLISKPQTNCLDNVVLASGYGGEFLLLRVA